jgi:ABC-2 type transport system permease protein
MPVKHKQLRGASHWLRSFWLIAKWEALSLKSLLPLIIVFQLAMGIGLVLGLGLFFQELSELQAVYLSTGAVAVNMLLIGMVMAPQVIISRKESNVYDFIWSLPFPRIASTFAAMLVWMAVAIPGSLLTLLVAGLVYRIPLDISPLFPVAALMTVLAAGSIGFAMAHAIPNPRVTHLLTQVLFLFILLFSPISYPVENLPGIMSVIHAVLPFKGAADIIRGTLTTGYVTNVGLSFLMTSLWIVASWLLTLRALTMRR